MQSITIAIIQFAPVWQNVAASLEKLDTILKKVPKDTKLVVLPEMFATGFSMDVSKILPNDTDKILNWMHFWSDKFIICGSLAIDVERKYYNRLMVIDKSKVLGHYDKHYLFSMAKEDEIFHPGEQKLVLNIGGFKMAFFICYDLRFPEWLRNTMNYDAAIIIASWPEKRIIHWNTLLKARAIENQSFVLACNRVGNDGEGLFYNGYSQILNPMGEQILSAIDEETILYTVLNLDEVANIRQSLPFLKDIKV